MPMRARSAWYDTAAAPRGRAVVVRNVRVDKRELREALDEMEREELAAADPIADAETSDVLERLATKR